MQTKMKLLAAAGATIMGLIAAAPANAAAVIDFRQVGANVVATLAGSLNTTGSTITTGYQTTANAAISPNTGQLVFGSSGVAVSLYSPLSGPDQFGTGGVRFADTFSGTALFLSGSELYLPASYMSLGQLNATSTFNNVNLATLGLSSTSSVYRLISGDTITIQGVTAGAVPEPATWLTMILGMGAIGFAMRRRKTFSTTVQFA